MANFDERGRVCDAATRRCFLKLAVALASVALVGCPEPGATGDLGETGETGETGGESRGLGEAGESGEDCEDVGALILPPFDPEDLDDEGLVWVSQALADDLGLLVGDQLRVERTPDEYALYTVAEVLDEGGARILRMNLDGRLRLGTGAELICVDVDTAITDSELSDAAAEASGGFVERLVDPSGDWLVLLAPHGGEIEPDTDDQAERVRDSLAQLEPSSWICKGWGEQTGDALRRYHVASTAISARSFPLLGSIVGREFCHAVSFHGAGDGNLDALGQTKLQVQIVIGGLGPVCVKQALRDAILAHTNADDLALEQIVVIDADGPLPGNYTGTSERNLVNWLTAQARGGIQLEQTRWVRKQYADEIADAVAEVYAGLADAGCPYVCP